MHFGRDQVLPLPLFNSSGDLPPGVHAATLGEVVARFGQGHPQREEVTRRLIRIAGLAVSTGALDRLIVFGSYVSEQERPNDVDVVLILRDDFRPAACPRDATVLLDHHRATTDLGASVFWMRPAMLLGESLEEFIAQWQVKRDGDRRGIVEVSV